MIKPDIAKSKARRLDKKFNFRWEIYDKHLKSLLDKNIDWLDLGCGNNLTVNDLSGHCHQALGMDIQSSDETDMKNFVRGDIYQIPFDDNTFDLITMAFVVEHLDKPDKAFTEIKRILKPGSKVLIMTTNIKSPLIFIPNLLPVRLKRFLQRQLFKVSDNDIFPTHHKLNSKSKINGLSKDFEITHFEYVQDTNISGWIVFGFFFAWHLFCKLPLCSLLNTNFITILKKRQYN